MNVIMLTLALLAPADTGTYHLVPGLSKASYAVDEVFFSENNRLFTAVGVTTAVTGQVFIDRERLSRSRVDEVLIDLRALQSDSDRRDRALREKYLDTNAYPQARLSNATFTEIPATSPDERTFHFRLTGDLTVHGVTQRTTWTGEARFTGNGVTGVARTEVKMSAFGIEVPNLRALKAEDDVKLTLEFTARRHE